MVVLLHNKVVYLEERVWGFVQIDHTVVQLDPFCHQGGSIKMTGGPCITNLWSS